jgi:hypothetical protein
MIGGVRVVRRSGLCIAIWLDGPELKLLETYRSARPIPKGHGMFGMAEQ